jgi:hypothetical protein
VLLLWLVLGIAVSLRTLYRPESHTVFPVLAAGARHWWADQPLYAEYKPLDYFRYPPVLAIFLSPLAALGHRAGGVLWAWLSLAVYGAGLWAFARAVVPRRWPPGRTAWFMALGALGGLRGLWNGQSNALVVGLLLLGAAALVRRRWWRAAFLLGGSVSLKLTPLAPVLLLCAAWPRKLAARLAVALAVFAAIPFLTRPPAVAWHHYRDFLAHLADSSRERWPGFRDAWTVWQVVRHFGGESGPIPLKEPLDSPAYRILQLLTATAALGWCLWQRHRLTSRRQRVTLTLGIGLAWLMLFGPAVEYPTYVFLAASLCWGLLEERAWPAGRWLIRSAFVLIMVLGWGALTRPWLDSAPVLLAALPVGSALFLVWLLGYARATTNPSQINARAGPDRSCPAAWSITI